MSACVEGGCFGSQVSPKVETSESKGPTVPRSHGPTGPTLKFQTPWSLSSTRTAGIELQGWITRAPQYHRLGRLDPPAQTTSLNSAERSGTVANPHKQDDVCTNWCMGVWALSALLTAPKGRAKGPADPETASTLKRLTEMIKESSDIHSPFPFLSQATEK